MKVVIVGGVAGGATAAARIRRLDEQAEIIVFERSGFVSYANCGLPYYIGGVITEEAELTLQTPESFWSRFRIKVKTNHEVTAVHVSEKTVRVKDLTTGEEWDESYDKLILSPGARPTRPNLPGIDSGKIFTLRTVEDTLRIHEYVEAAAPKSAVLVGGGYIGIEVAENLRKKGLDITIVQRPKQLMNTLDYDMATLVHSEVRRNGVVLRLGSSVTGFREENGQIVTLLDGEDGIPADMVLLAIGVSPDSKLAKEAGLELGVKGSIAVNDRMETSAPDIYAVGDAVQVKHFVTGDKLKIAFVGDGVHDRQAFAASDVGIAHDARSAFQDGVDVSVFGTDLRKIPQAHRIAKAARMIFFLNIGAALGIKILCFVLCFAGIFPFPLAAGLDALVSILGMLNCLRGFYLN